MNNKFIQIKEASEILGVTKLTLRNWDKSGKLVAYRHPMSNYRVYKHEDIEHIMNQIESGRKPINSNKKSLSPTQKSKDAQKPKVYTLKVLHLKD